MITKLFSIFAPENYKIRNMFDFDSLKMWEQSLKDVQAQVGSLGENISEAIKEQEYNNSDKAKRDNVERKPKFKDKNMSIEEAQEKIESMMPTKEDILEALKPKDDEVHFHKKYTEILHKAATFYVQEQLEGLKEHITPENEVAIATALAKSYVNGAIMYRDFFGKLMRLI